MSSFENVLIVGANRGIGLGLVEESLKVSSAKVFATAREPEKASALIELTKTYPGRLFIIKTDMLSEESLKGAVSHINKHTTSIDVAIFNAAISRGSGRIEDLTPADLLENLEGNIVGIHSLFRVFSPLLLASKVEKRTIGVISSIVASLGALPQVNPFIKAMYKKDYLQISGYSVTKTGLNMLARQWADQLEPQGVAVALIHPGAVATDMNKGDDLITVAESAEKVIKVIDQFELEKAGDGIFSYDGSLIPW